MVRKHLSYANVAATLALLLAISGVAYAASLPRNSVGTRALKDQAVTTPKLDRGAVTEKKVKNFALRLRDLGGIINHGTATVDTQINLAAGECEAVSLTLRNPPPKGSIGSLVVGKLTDDQGDAVMDNHGFLAPTLVSETSQGGVIPHLMVCDRNSGQTIPVGSVFRYHLIGP
jgi:hypothetical protein